MKTAAWLAPGRSMHRIAPFFRGVKRRQTLARHLLSSILVSHNKTTHEILLGECYGTSPPGRGKGRGAKTTGPKFNPQQAERPLLLTITLSLNLVMYMDISLVIVRTASQTLLLLRRSMAPHGPRRTKRRRVSLKCPCTPSGAGCFRDSVSLPLPQDLYVSWRHESSTDDSYHPPPRDLGVRGASIVRASTHETRHLHYICTIEAPRTPRSRGGGRYECRFHASKKHKILSLRVSED